MKLSRVWPYRIDILSLHICTSCTTASAWTAPSLSAPNFTNSCALSLPCVKYVCSSVSVRSSFVGSVCLYPPIRNVRAFFITVSVPKADASNLSNFFNLYNSQIFCVNHSWRYQIDQSHGQGPHICLLYCALHFKVVSGGCRTQRTLVFRVRQYLAELPPTHTRRVPLALLSEIRQCRYAAGIPGTFCSVAHPQHFLVHAHTIASMLLYVTHSSSQKPPMVAICSNLLTSSVLCAHTSEALCCHLLQFLACVIAGPTDTAQLNLRHTSIFQEMLRHTFLFACPSLSACTMTFRLQRRPWGPRSVGERLEQWHVLFVEKATLRSNEWKESQLSSGPMTLLVASICGANRLPPLTNTLFRIVWTAETDFGQTDFGHPYFPTLAKSDFGQTDFGQKNLTDFGQP